MTRSAPGTAKIAIVGAGHVGVTLAYACLIRGTGKLYKEIYAVFERVVGSRDRFADRRDPELCPADAIPVEFVLMSYPILDLPPLPEGDDQAADEGSPDG